MRVVRLAEELNDAGYLGRRAEENEAERSDGCAADIVIHVGDSDVEQAADGRVGACASVGHGDCMNTAVA